MFLGNRDRPSREYAVCAVSCGIGQLSVAPALCSLLLNYAYAKRTAYDASTTTQKMPEMAKFNFQTDLIIYEHICPALVNGSLLLFSLLAFLLPSIRKF